MTPTRPKTVFISHDASRTGAPMVLLHLLRWIRENLDLPFVVVLGRRGPLQAAFEALAPTYVWSGAPSRGPRGLLSPVRRKTVIRALKRHGCDLIYANSAASAPILEHLHGVFGAPA